MAKMISAQYITSSQWNLDEILKGLEITEDKVVDHYVKWDKLYLTYLDADDDEVQEEFEPNVFSASDNFDYKRPTEIVEYQEVDE